MHHLFRLLRSLVDDDTKDMLSSTKHILVIVIVTMADYRCREPIFDNHSDDGSSGPEIIHGKADNHEPYPSSSEATYESPKSTRSTKDANNEFAAGLGQNSQGSSTVVPSQRPAQLFLPSAAVARRGNNNVSGTAKKSNGKGTKAAKASSVKAKAKPKAAAKAKAQTKSKTRGSGFRDIERERMLTIAEQMMPVHGLEWDRVAEEHYKYFPDENRSGESLKRQFQCSCGDKTPTGEHV